LALIPKDAAHKGKEGLAAYVRTTFGLPYVQRLPEEMRQEFINEIVEKYIAVHPPDSEGFVHLQMMRLEVEAEKKLRWLAAHSAAASSAISKVKGRTRPAPPR
jgi:hypothetical protein